MKYSYSKNLNSSFESTEDKVREALQNIGFGVLAEINIKVVDAVDDVSPGEDSETPKKPQLTMNMRARKTIDGNMIVSDHNDIDIVVMPKKMKVVTFAKDSMGDSVYDAQSRLFDYLAKKGVVEPSSVVGGDVYSSLEATILPSDTEGVSAVQMTLFLIGKYLEQEKPYYTFVDNLEDKENDLLTDPDEDSSTELGDVPHDDMKGSIVPGLRPYGLLYRIWEGKRKK